MRIFKHTVKKNGENLTMRKFYADVKLPGGKRVSLPLFEKENLSQEFADKLEVMISQYGAGIAYDKHVQAWLSQVSPFFMERFSRWGLVDASRAEGGRPINDLLGEWRDSLIAGGTGKGHADQNHHRAKRVFSEAGLRLLLEITADKVMATIGRLQTTVHKKNKVTGKVELSETGGTSSFTKLHHLRAVKQFCKWAHINHRLSDNPVQHLTIKNVRVETERRALSTDEIACLLAYAETAPERWNVAGHERALVYEIAASTGLRRDEIKSLKRTSFDFEGLSVKVKAEHTKNKKAALLPIRAALMEKIKDHLATKMPTAPAFNLPEAASKLIKRDLSDARKQWVEAAKKNPSEHQSRNDSDFLKDKTYSGKVDFHSLRVTFATMLAASGCSPKVAMDLLRHSDINLTMKVYSRSNSQQQTEAVDGLPSFDKPKLETKKKA